MNTSRFIKLSEPRGSRGMKGKLRFRFFAHSWLSDWNHGNAHFLRGPGERVGTPGPRGSLL